MGAGFDDPAFVQHDDAVGPLYRRQAVGDDDGGATDHRGFERALHQALGFGVERAGGFVQQQQRRILEQGARDRDALALAARQAHPALAQERGIALRQALDEIVGGGHLRRGDHLVVAGVRAAVADVFHGVEREDHGILRHDADRAAQRLQRQVTHVHAVEADAAGLRIVEAQQQLEQGGLAGAGRADHGHRLAGADIEREMRQGGFVQARRIGEGHVVERHAGAVLGARGQVFGLQRILDLGLRAEQFEQAFGGAGGALGVAHHFRQGADRTGDDAGVQDELAQVASGHGSFEHGVGAEPQHEHDGAEYQHDGQHGQRGAGADAAHGGAEGAFDFP